MIQTSAVGEENAAAVTSIASAIPTGSASPTATATATAIAETTEGMEGVGSTICAEGKSKRDEDGDGRADLEHR